MDMQTDPRTAFIDYFGTFAAREGLSPIAGRIFAMLFYDGETRPLAELSHELGVSKASVSTNARLLANLGLLQRVRRPGDRRDHYRVGHDAPSALLDGMLERMSEMVGFLQDINARQSDPQCSARLNKFIDFHTGLTQVIQNFADRRSLNHGTSTS